MMMFMMTGAAPQCGPPPDPAARCSRGGLRAAIRPQSLPQSSHDERRCRSPATAAEHMIRSCYNMTLSPLHVNLNVYM